MRTAVSWLLVVVAALFALIGLTMPLTLRSQAAEDRAYYQQFRQAAAYYNANGRLPTEETLRRLNVHSEDATIWSSLSLMGEGCDSTFVKAKSDRFVIGFWRGEWFECYAHPSGTTTLPMSVTAYLSSGLGIDVVTYWLIAIIAAWAALRIRKRKRAVAPNVRSPPNRGHRS